MYQQQRIITSDYQIGPQDEYTVILVYALNADVNIYLPYASNFDKVIILKADDTLNEVFVHLKGMDTFEGGGGPYRLSRQYQLVNFTTDNDSKWYTVSSYSSGSAASSGGSGGVSIHADLQGLLANDHRQYLHVSGSNFIANNLDMHGFSIIDVTNINDVNILTLTASIDGHILDTNNPHATTFSNLDPGTLAELNFSIIDANLDDSGSARPALPHSASHLSGGSDPININQLGASGIPEGHLFRAGPNGNITTFPSSAFAPNDHGQLNGLGDNDHPQYALTSSFFEFSQSVKSFTSSVTVFSASYSSRISSLEAQSGSITSSIQVLQNASSSFVASIGNLQNDSASFSARTTDLETTSSTFVSQISDLNVSASNFAVISSSYKQFSASFVEYSASWSSFSGGGGSTDISALNSFSQSIQNFTASTQSQTASVQTFSASSLAASASFESRQTFQTASITRLDNASASYAAFSASFVGYSASWSAGTTDIAPLNNFSASIQNQTASVQIFSASILAASSSWTGVSQSYHGFSASHASRHLSGGADPIDAQSLRADGLGANRLLITNFDGGWTTVPSSSVGAGGGATDITALNESSASLQSFTASVQSQTASIQTFSASMLAASGAFATISSSYKQFSASFTEYSASWSSITPTDVSALNSFSASMQTFTASVQAQTASVQTFSASMLAASASFESRQTSQTASIVRLDNSSASYAAFSASFVGYSASWSSITATDITALNFFSQSVQLQTASVQTFSASIQSQTASIQTFSASILAASSSWTGVSQSYHGFSASHASRHLSGGADPIDAQSLRADGIAIDRLLISNGLGGWTTVPSASVGGGGGGGGNNSALNAFSASVQNFTASIQSQTASIQTFSASILEASGAFATISSSYKEFSASFVGYSASWSTGGGTDISALNSFSASIQVFSASMLTFSESHASRHLSGGADAIDVQSLRGNGIAVDRLLISNGLGGWTTVPSSSIASGGGGTGIPTVHHLEGFTSGNHYSGLIGELTGSTTGFIAMALVEIQEISDATGQSIFGNANFGSDGWWLNIESSLRFQAGAHIDGVTTLLSAVPNDNQFMGLGLVLFGIRMITSASVNNFELWVQGRRLFTATGTALYVPSTGAPTIGLGIFGNVAEQTGIVGVQYLEGTLTDAQLRTHFAECLAANDVISPAGQGWTTWSVKRGAPGAVWAPSDGTGPTFVLTGSLTTVERAAGRFLT